MKVLTAALAALDVRLTCIRRIVDLDLLASRRYSPADAQPFSERS